MIRTRFAALVTLVAVVGFGAPQLLAGGEGCNTAHSQADYQKMAEKMAKKGWLGLKTEKAANGSYAVSEVTSGSPAAQAGFRVGDVLVALEGVALGEQNKEQLGQIKQGFAPGKRVTYTVSRAGSEQRLTATLGRVPREVLAQWLGDHVLEHTPTVLAQAN